MFVKAGETVTVQLYPSLSEFTQVDERGERGVQAGEYKASAWRSAVLCTAHTLLDCVRTAGLRTCARRAASVRMPATWLRAGTSVTPRTLDAGVTLAWNLPPPNLA